MPGVGYGKMNYMRGNINEVYGAPPTESLAQSEFLRTVEDYKIVSYEATDLSAEAEILLANQIQGADYLRSGYIEPCKLDAEGCILDLNDARRDVTYVLAYRNDQPAEDIEGSLKVIRPPLGEGLEVLAAYEYAEGALYIGFKSQLLKAHRDDPEGGVVEIGGLSRVEQPKSPLVSYELIREIMQRAVREQTDEKWFITFTEKAFKPILASFGPNVIQRAGDSVVIDEPNEHVTLVPSVIEPCKLIDNLAQSVVEEPDERKRAMLSMTLLLMADGLRPSEISNEAQTVITIVNNVRELRHDKS